MNLKRCLLGEFCGNYKNTYNINIKDKELPKIVTNLPAPAYLVGNQRCKGCHIGLTQPPICHAI